MIRSRRGLASCADAGDRIAGEGYRQAESRESDFGGALYMREPYINSDVLPNCLGILKKQIRCLDDIFFS